jgi:type II secretory pathway pseudopilin PulG
MISPDDYRLTAYASGDLPPEEAARFETELASDPAAREHVAQLRALQSELGAVFTAEAAAEDVEENEASRVVEFPQEKEATKQPWRLPDWFAPFAVAACLVLMAGAVVLPTVGKVRETANRTVASSNLRQIGQAALIYASDHKDKLPVVDNVWDYAAALARDGGLNDATIWVTGNDSANANQGGRLSTVLTSDRAVLDPVFRELKPSWAVPLGEITANMPATTPIAWTRGLKADGTWSKHSPYGTDGGHIVFLGGNVQWYRNLADKGSQLVRFDGKGSTSNILEALPPGTRIGEYVPTEGE